MTTTTNRPIYEIADEIRKDWKNPYFGAKPYIDAMCGIGDITDNYYCDSAKSVLSGFIANAGSWRGDTAKRVKAEIKAMIK